MTACEYKKVDIVDYLLNDLGDTLSIAAMAPSTRGTEVSVKHRQRGRTALHIAAAHNSVDIIEMLIDKECPPAIQDRHVR